MTKKKSLLRTDTIIALYEPMREAQREQSRRAMMVDNYIYMIGVLVPQWYYELLKITTGDPVIFFGTPVTPHDEENIRVHWLGPEHDEDMRKAARAIHKETFLG